MLGVGQRLEAQFLFFSAHTYWMINTHWRVILAPSGFNGTGLANGRLTALWTGNAAATFPTTARLVSVKVRDIDGTGATSITYPNFHGSNGHSSIPPFMSVLIKWPTAESRTLQGHCYYSGLTEATINVYSHPRLVAKTIAANAFFRQNQVFGGAFGIQRCVFSRPSTPSTGNTLFDCKNSIGVNIVTNNLRKRNHQVALLANFGL